MLHRPLTSIVGGPFYAIFKSYGWEVKKARSYYESQFCRMHICHTWNPEGEHLLFIKT